MWFLVIVAIQEDCPQPVDLGKTVNFLQLDLGNKRVNDLMKLLNFLFECSNKKFYTNDIFIRTFLRKRLK